MQLKNVNKWLKVHGAWSIVHSESNKSLKFIKCLKTRIWNKFVVFGASRFGLDLRVGISGSLVKSS